MLAVSHKLAFRNDTCGARRRLILFAVLLGWTAAPRAALAVEDSPGAWLTVTTTDAFQGEEDSGRWQYWFDAQARYFDIGSGINQYLVRPGIGYKLGGSMTAWLGYARFRTRNRAGNVTDENRYWQQLNWTVGRWLDGTVTMRARLEERSVSSGDDTGLVLRLSTKYVRPLRNAKETRLVVSLEPFVDLRNTDWGGQSGLGQNRAFVGIGWRLSKRISVEAGYMNQYVWVDNGEDLSNHFGVLNFRLQL